MASRVLSPAAHVAYARMRWNRYRAAARLAKLEACGERAARLARAVRATRDDELGDSGAVIERIEVERSLLLANSRPLIGAEGGDAGPYDRGQTVAQACGVSKRRGPATALHMIVREFRPKLGLELGTNLGISAAYQASAMAMAGGGRLVTCEGSPIRSRIARSVHERLGLDNVSHVVGLFAETLDATLDAESEFDYAFIDGHHQKQPTLDYFDALWPHLTDHAVVIFDDIRWSDGMREAWAILRADPRFAIAVDLDVMGVCITTRHPGERCMTDVIPV